MIYKIGQIQYDQQKLPTLGENVFQNFGKMSVVQLGIQAPPGTRFLLNNTDFGIITDIEIGITGIFELDLKDANTIITWLSFTKIQVPDNPAENWNILIDFLYYN